MKYIKKLIMATSLMVASLGMVSFSANAAIITQDMFDSEGYIGTISVNTRNADTFGGFAEVTTPMSFNFLGFDVPAEQTEFFLAVIDPANLNAGIEYLNFDVNLFLPEFGVDWAFNGEFDSFAPEFAFYDVFDNNTGNPVFFDAFYLGEASVVSEPATIAMFSLMLLMIGLRRKS